jgi:hypothetical protein
LKNLLKRSLRKKLKRSPRLLIAQLRKKLLRLLLVQAKMLLPRRTNRKREPLLRLLQENICPTWK